MEIKQIIGILLTVILYGIFAGIISYCFRQEYKNIYEKIKAKQKLQAEQSDKNTQWMRHLDTLWKANFQKRGNGMCLVAISLLLLCVVTGVSALRFSWIAALIIGGFVAATPYILLRGRLEHRRRDGSQEGEMLLVAILSKYRICGGNINESIERVVSDELELVKTKHLLFRLLIDLRGSGNQEEIRQAAENFSYAIHTNWSKSLAKHIEIAATTGVNIAPALEDLLIQLRSARAIAEERKRLNAESVRMAKYMAPGMYLATIVLSVKYLDVSFSKFLSNQFQTAEGLTCFSLVAILFALNMLLIHLMNHQKFDF